jgi:hypothetical protein
LLFEVVVASLFEVTVASLLFLIKVVVDVIVQINITNASGITIPTLEDNEVAQDFHHCSCNN